MEFSLHPKLSKQLNLVYSRVGQVGDCYIVYEIQITSTISANPVRTNVQAHKDFSINSVQ